MEDGSIADDVAAILFGAYGRGRVPRRFWNRVVDVARRGLRPGDVSDATSLIEAAYAIRAERLVAERALRLLVALVYEVYGTARVGRENLLELAQILGVSERDLRRYYHESDVLTLDLLLKGEPIPTPRPMEPQIPRQHSEPQVEGYAEGPGAFIWWAMYGALSSWTRARHGQLPAASSERPEERDLAAWLDQQSKLLASGLLVPPRAAELKRLMANGSAGRSRAPKEDDPGSPRDLD